MLRQPLFLLLLIPLLAACGSISEGKACDLATADLKAREAKNIVRGLKVTGCSNFESNSDAGYAKVQVNGSWEELSYLGPSFPWNKKKEESFTLKKTDQGWKVN